MNVYDLDGSPLARNGFARNSADAFPLIRVCFLMRGLMAACGVESSMVDRWEPFALAVLEADDGDGLEASGGRGGGGGGVRRDPLLVEPRIRRLHHSGHAAHS